MATKETGEQLERERIDEQVRKISQDMEELVPVKLFKDSGRYTDDVFVRMNNKTFQIKRGVRVEVPRYVVEILNNSDAQDRLAANKLDEYADGLK